jgi:hypothetical protein
MHCADGDVPARGLDVLVEHLEWQTGLADRSLRALKLGFRAHEYAELVRQEPCGRPVLQPCGNRLALFGLAHRRHDCWRRSIEHRYGVVALLGVPVGVGDVRPKQPICLLADLVGGSVVDAQGPRPTANVHAERLP